MFGIKFCYCGSFIVSGEGPESVDGEALAGQWKIY